MKFKYTILICILLLVGCSDDYLDKEPLSDVTENNFFLKASDLQLYTNGFYRMLPSTSIYDGDAVADNIVSTTLSEEMRGARTIPTTGGGWDWAYLRDINYFIENYEKCEDESAKLHYSGVAYFFRAYFYFQKLQRFGEVPYYETTISADDMESLQAPRESRQFITDRILEDLDRAIANLNEEVQAYRITKYSALALKSRVALYEGTFGKYRNLPGFETYLNASVDASLELMENSPYGVYSTGSTGTDYMNLFNSQDAQTSEMILSRQFTQTVAVDHNVNYYTTTSSYGRPGMPKDLVNSYLMADGSRFTDLPNYNQIFFTDEVADRDPRLSQTVRTPGYTRKGEAMELAPNLGATMTGYQLIKYVSEPVYDTYDESISDLPVLRFGEVLLNFAEAKAELGTLSQADLDASVQLLRNRVGMPAMSLDDANSNPDAFLEDQYPNVSGANKGVILEIRRERRIELYMENHRWNDVVRWKAGQALTKPLRGLYFPGAGEYDMDSDGNADVVLFEGDEPEGQVQGVQYIKIGSDIFFDADNLIDPQPDFNNRMFDEERDYLYPLPRVELQLNPNLTQNPGWE
ncbi:RagB/SusD family nutrient uptake outer membrane protein [Zobellia galactanivorans]|uniref:SusD/RagB family lipoprotein n=1 Tax=Zobellia galactanivorans (strain DSM 12802 / CCUG 47099 / CIP 106680 / NCIMB 13871 / Dsij) TaxID=63186 RepID=G0L7I5_ZOBGA|nr:RagB/SusD family nutrient uptake outer membrane protein [Zobellia galactanivorans]MBU3026341.1 RagB/SusD family nutrient uptake outer membrane protein [Zobellia galactanivorans]MDO6807666.1 RagB/SusD family nutrient uptake outer membrane protein [Zobellia galactanivorans]CAZ98084.1 SusD/RagB family lipoprotein [Zobellia galactanivorans]